MTESKIAEDTNVKIYKVENIIQNCQKWSSVVRSHHDDLITIIDNSSDNEVQLYFVDFEYYRKIIYRNLANKIFVWFTKISDQNYIPFTKHDCRKQTRRYQSATSLHGFP